MYDCLSAILGSTFTHGLNNDPIDSFNFLILVRGGTVAFYSYTSVLVQLIDDCQHVIPAHGFL